MYYYINYYVISISGGESVPLIFTADAHVANKTLSISLNAQANKNISHFVKYNSNKNAEILMEVPAHKHAKKPKLKNLIWKVFLQI